MNPKYAKFFEPLMINKMLLKNRFAMAPMGTGTEENDGMMGPRTIGYYEERAKGGAAMIMTEAQYVTNRFDGWLSHFTIADTDDQMKCWDELAERVHAHGAKLCIQLGCSLGRNAYVFDGGDGGDMVSASENESLFVPGKMCRPMTIDEIHYTVGCYERAARRCITAGADAIELNAHAGYLLDQFMTKAWNRRTDEYGGSMENRVRFIREIYEAIRGVVGPDFPIMFRMAGFHDFEGGRTLEETIEIAKYLESLGMDAFDFDRGSYESKLWVSPSSLMGYSCMADIAATIKKELHVPVMNAGSHTVDSAIEYLNRGDVDMIMMGRQLIADPDVPNKIFRGQEADIRPCIFCSMCVAREMQNVHLNCAVNPHATQEGRYPITKTDSPKKVVVVGGGPAGMEAAHVAAMQGHEVTLYEKSDKLGGQLLPASAPPFKKRLLELSVWEQRQLDKYGVKVVLNHPIDENSPELEDAHKIIVALGATPVIPKMKGIENENVIEVTQAHANPELVKGDTILVAGGGQSGCDAALEYAMAGKHSIIVEMKDRIIPEEWLTDNIDPVVIKLDEYKVERLLSTKIECFTPEGAVVTLPDGSSREIKADTIITAFGMRPQKELAEKICAKYSNAAINVGDSTGLGKVYGAVRKGFFAGWSVGDDIC